LEKLIQPTSPANPVIPVVPSQPVAATAPNTPHTPVPSPSVATPTADTALTPIPGEGLIITAQQLVQVFSGLAINELSCARVIPEQIGKQSATTGIVLFTTQAGSPRAKGGAMEVEFSAGKISRIAFQSPSYRDFEQDVIDHPDVGGCSIDSEFLAKLH
jgi:hypothetical protein